jgi:hypothetical protein
MKIFIYCALACTLGMLTGCASSIKVSPKPNIVPVATSHAKERASMKKVRSHIKEAQDHESASLSALQRADAKLTKLLKSK